MRKHLGHQSWIVLAAAVVFFTNLGVTALWDEDEPLYASCARDMLVRGDWVVPTYNGELFPDKPPLMFWTMMAAFKIFGVNEFGARFFSAVFGIAAALATYHLGRRMFSARVGFWAGLIVSSTIIFTVSARAATVDAALTLLTTLAMLAFVFGGIARRGEAEEDADTTSTDSRSPRDFAPQGWLTWVGIWALLGLAVLAKGPVGLLLPAAAIGLFGMITNHQQQAAAPNRSRRSVAWTDRLLGIVRCLRPGNFLRSLWQMRPITGVVVVLAVALPWYVLVGLRTDGAWLAQFFAKYNLRPFTEPILGHSGPIWYYVPAVFIGFFPWTVFLGPTLFDTVRRVRERHPWHAGYVLLACWFGVFFVFWSICRTKLPHYVLPTYPALALLTACFIDGWLVAPHRSWRWWPQAASGIMIFVGIGFVVALPIIASIYVPGEGLLGMIGLIPIAGGAGFWICVEHRRRERAVAVFAVTAVVFVTAVFGFAAVRIDRYQNARPMIAAVRQDAAADARLVAYGSLRESVVFYAGGVVPCTREPDQLKALVEDPTPLYLITRDRHEPAIEKHFPGTFDVLLRQPMFLDKGEVVVLVRRGEPPHTADKPGTARRR